MVAQQEEKKRSRPEGLRTVYFWVSSQPITVCRVLCSLARGVAAEDQGGQKRKEEGEWW
jgi:hypothetical protein